jgi:hypothetical protein
MKHVIREGFIGVKAFYREAVLCERLVSEEGSLPIVASTRENPTVRQYIRCLEGPTIVDYTLAYLRQFG